MGSIVLFSRRQGKLSLRVQVVSRSMLFGAELQLESREELVLIEVFGDAISLFGSSVGI